MKGGKKWPGNLLLVVSSTLLTLVAFEVLLNFTNLVPETDQSASGKVYQHYPGYYKFVPNLKNVSFTGTDIDTNAFGFRDDKMRLEKDNDTYRIAVLGDSWGFGWGMKYEKSFVRLLEHSLQNMYAPQSIEMLNFAVPGHNMLRYPNVLENEVLQFNPDFCILFLHLNDIEIRVEKERPLAGPLNDIENHVEEERPLAGQYQSDLITYIKYLKLSKLVYARVLLPTAIKLGISNNGLIDSFKRKYAHDSPGFVQYQSSLENLVDLLEQNDLEIMVFLLPLSLASGNPYQLQAVNDIVKETFSKHGIQVRELLENYPYYPKDKLTIHAFDGHPTEFASALLAEEIFSELVTGRDTRLSIDINSQK